MQTAYSPPLSLVQTNRALRIFLLTGVFWAVWSVTSGIGTSLFTGYLLWAGATPADIANLTALAFFTCLVQVVSIQYIQKFRNRKRVTVVCGFFEVFFRFLTVCLPLVFAAASYRVIGFYGLVVVGLCFGYTASPIFNDWMSQTIPEKLQARFTGERTLANVLTAVIIGYLAGYYIDSFPHGEERFRGFACLLILGTVSGVSGYLVLLKAPMPEQPDEERGSFFDALAEMVRKKPFLRLLVFSVWWRFAIGLAAPFTSIFMIQDLHLSFKTMAIYTNIALVATILSYRPLAWLISRFGSKPVIQFLLIPGVVGYVLRVFARQNFHLLLPVSFTCFAVLGAGISVATMPLLYSQLPRKADRSPYFAAWSSMIFLFGGVAPLLGGVISTRLKGVHFNWFGFPVLNHQIVFLVTGALLVGLFPLARRLEEPGAREVSGLVGQVWKGSPIAFIYNLFTMNLPGSEVRRARAASGLARSGSPLAEEELIKALGDISPDVRREAVQGLSRVGSEEAVAPLIKELANQESDLRAEAAAALGRIGHPLSLGALHLALDDEDPRVRISAVRALGDIRNAGVHNLLSIRLQREENRLVFPTLVDALSRIGDDRIVKLAIERLSDYRSPVVRAQILNSICRVLGAGERFYRMAVLDEQKQAGRILAVLKKARDDASALPAHLASLQRQSLDELRSAQEHFERGDASESLKALIALAHLIVQETETLCPEEPNSRVHAIRSASEALLGLFSSLPADQVTEEVFLFAIISTARNLRVLRETGISET